MINAIIIMMNITFLSFVYYIYITMIIKKIYKRKNKETIIFTI